MAFNPPSPGLNGLNGADRLKKNSNVLTVEPQIDALNIQRVKVFAANSRRI